MDSVRPHGHARRGPASWLVAVCTVVLVAGTPVPEYLPLAHRLADVLSQSDHLLVRGTAQLPSPAPQSGSALPDLATLLTEVRQGLRSPEETFRQYRYLQRVTEYTRDSSGRIVKTAVRVYEVVPDLRNGAGYSRVLERDGRPVPAAEAAELARDQQNKIQAAIRRRQNETRDDRLKRLAGEAAEQRNQQRTIEDIFRLYDFRMIGRETIGNEPVIVLAFSPRPGVEPQTDNGRILAKAGGRAWVSETDRQVVRLDLESRDTITYGLGIIARVRPGARLRFERERTPEGWFPASYTFVAHVMLLLVKPMDFDQKAEYYDFRPFPPADLKLVPAIR
jgi:hypothetical protein